MCVTNPGLLVYLKNIELLNVFTSCLNEYKNDLKKNVARP